MFVYSDRVYLVNKSVTFIKQPETGKCGNEKRKWRDFGFFLLKKKKKKKKKTKRKFQPIVPSRKE